jgi:hypothetical protein
MKLWHGFAILAAVLLVACHGSRGYVVATDGSRVPEQSVGWRDAEKTAARRSAAHDLPCEESRIMVTHPTETQITADGCGQRAVHTVNSEGSSYRVEADGTTIMERPLLVNRFSLAAPAR